MSTDKIDLLIEDYIKNETFPVVHKDMIKKILNYHKSDIVKDEYSYLLELYSEYIDKINSLDTQIRNEALTIFKGADLIDNQRLEKEDSFLIRLFLQVEKKHAIDLLLTEKTLNKDLLLNTHKMLLQGTSTKESDCGIYRSNNRKFVGSWKNNERCIQYLPIPYKEIDEAMEEFFTYYNNDSGEDLFYKPFLIHGIIAALQAFNDGNTRLARLLQHTKLWEETNKYYTYDYPSPLLYITRTYFPHREKYRSLIKDLAINPTDETVNNWLLFNMQRSEEQIWINNENIEKVKRLKK